LTEIAELNINSLLPATGKRRRGPKTPEGLARIAAAASISTPARWEAVWASGGTALGPVSEKGRASKSAFNRGWTKSKKTRAKMSKRAELREKRKKEARAHAEIAALGVPLASVHRERK
jgi:hypothetical protein